jgi:hypothetical protein
MVWWKGHNLMRFGADVPACLFAAMFAGMCDVNRCLAQVCLRLSMRIESVMGVLAFTRAIWGFCGRFGNHHSQYLEAVGESIAKLAFKIFLR